MISLADVEVPTDPPWAALGNAGAAVLVLATVWMFMRFLREQAAAADARAAASAAEARAERELQRAEFTGALDRITRAFGERVESIATATRESNERVEAALRDLVARRAG